MEAKRIIIFILTLMFCLYPACKDYQMDSDPLGDLVVEVSGTVSAPSSWLSNWTRVKVYGQYAIPGNPDRDDNLVYGTVGSGKWSLFAEKDVSVAVYLFNDINGNGAYDWPQEPRIPYTGNPVSVSEDDVGGAGAITVRKVWGTISSIPSFLENPIVALVCPEDPPGNCNADIHGHASVNQDGTYEIYGGAKSNYKLWIVDDRNDNGAYDYDDREPYVQIKERAGSSLCDDTFVLDITSGDMQVDITLGILSGSINNNKPFEYPQASLLQGWDVTAYNPIDDLNFQFFMVESYEIDSGGAQDQGYYILLFNDDNPHDGIYIYADEYAADEVKQHGSPYTSGQTGLSLDTL